MLTLATLPEEILFEIGLFVRGDLESRAIGEPRC